MPKIKSSTLALPPSARKRTPARIFLNDTMIATQTALDNATTNILSSVAIGFSTSTTVSSQTHNPKAVIWAPAQMVPAPMAISPLMTHEQRLHIWFPDQLWSSDNDLDFFTDSAKLTGDGVYIHGEWAYIPNTKSFGLWHKTGYILFRIDSTCNGHLHLGLLFVEF